ncbi:MAG: metallophosphoesterase [Bacteroidota bacterium]
MKFLYAIFFSIGIYVAVWAQPKPLTEWYCWPQYTLPGNASNKPGLTGENPLTPFKKLEYQSTPLLFFAEEPTERVINFLQNEKIPQGDFSLEMWLMAHVNQPVGALLTFKDKALRTEPDWLVGFYGKELIYTLKTAKNPYGEIINHEIVKGWSEYFLHVVAVYTQGKMQLFLNGNLIEERAVGERIFSTKNYELELAAYLNNEPYMDLGNLVKSLRIYDQPLLKEQINKSFGKYKRLVEKGILYPELFHFTAGPYLNYATKNSINLVWEADRQTTALIEYGTELPLQNKLEVKAEALIKEDDASPEHFINETTLTGLETGKKYFYKITLTDVNSKQIDSGLLTFSTAVAGDEAFAFAVIGDTEARPHVNDRVAKLIWDERPNFCLNLGDLTDGGKRRQKYQWNYEYFTGMTQLHSRIPVFPVAGNGESDLYWYNRYHALPEPEGYYKFSYGNADFFMLNSNKKEEFAPGGKQYTWLEEQLENSTAKWKFVAHHHAPYSADENDYGNSWEGESDFGDLKVREIVPLYEQYKVDMVFFGHLHTYQRTLPIRANQVSRENGVIYVQGGGGGGNLEDFAPARAWFSAKTYRGHHYFTINIFDNALSFKMYDTEGRLKDFLELKK